MTGPEMMMDIFQKAMGEQVSLPSLPSEQVSMPSLPSEQVSLPCLPSEQASLPSLPSELLERICHLLAFSDLVRVEAVCRRLRDSLHTSRVWRREAEQLAARLGFFLGEALVGLARRRGLGDRRDYKVVLALLSCTQRCVDRLGREEEQFKERLWQRVVARCTRREEETLVIELGEGHAAWLREVFGLFLEGEARRAKVQQVLHYREALELEAGPWLQVREDRIGGFFPKKNFQDSDVCDRIRDYVSWIERVQEPTAEEIEMVREVRGHLIFDIFGEVIDSVNGWGELTESSSTRAASVNTRKSKGQ